MDVISDGILTKVVGILKDATFRRNLCNCDFDASLVFRIDKVLSMDSHYTSAECSVVVVNGCMLTSFWGRDLTAKKCEHTQVTSFRTRFSDDQWKCVAKNNDLLIAVGAKFQNGFLDLSPLTCAIMPLHRMKDTDTPTQGMLVTEIFAGGFSGWSHAIKALVGQGVNMYHRWAIDRDPDCIEAYRKSHCPDLVGISHQQFWRDFWTLNEEPGQGREHVLMHSSINDRWWLTAFPESVDLCVASPPCPPWAITNSSPGFARCDGLTFVHMMAYVAWIRPKILIVENIATMTRHPHWKLIVALFQWAGYNIRGHHNLNLIDHIPQRRDRMILIATDSRSDFDEHHVFDKWPVSRPLSLRSYDAIMHDHVEWAEYIDISDQEMKMYLDVSLLPRDTTVLGHAKRSRRDLQQYRFRSEDSYAACFMTSYGRPCEVKEELITQGGLYGSLLVEGNRVRKFSPPEIVILQGTCGPCWISKNVRQAMKILGNCISIPHALWGLINGLFFLPEFRCERMPDVLFSRALSSHLNASNIAWESDEGGFRFFFRNTSRDDIPPTLPMLTFVKVSVKCATQEYEIICQDRVALHAVLQAITGVSIPQNIELRLNDNKEYCFQLDPDFTTRYQDIVLHVNVPSRLMITESTFRLNNHASSFVCIFTPEGLVVVPRHSGMKIEDIQQVVRHCHFLDKTHVNAIYQDHLGLPWSLEDRCPDCIVVVGIQNDCLRKPLNRVCIQKFVKKFQVFTAYSDEKTIQDMMQFLNTHGINQAIQSFGWHFTKGVSNSKHDSQTLLLSPRPGALPLTCESLQSLVIIRSFAAELEDISRSLLVGFQEALAVDYVNIVVRLASDHVWIGMLPKTCKLQVVVDAWNLAKNLFDDHSSLTLIFQGASVDPDVLFRNVIARGKGEVIFHLVPTGTNSESTPEIMRVDHFDGKNKSPNELLDLSWIALENKSFDELVSRVVASMLSSCSPQDSRGVELFQHLQLHETGDGFMILAISSQVDTLLSFFHDIGLNIALQKLGWQVVTEDSSTEVGVGSARARREGPFFKYETARARGPVSISWDVRSLHIIPYANEGSGVVTCCTKLLVESVIASSLFAFSIPKQIKTMGQVDNPCLVKVKLWNVWVFHGLVDGKWCASFFMDLWQQVMTFCGEQSIIRLISGGKGVNPDWHIDEFSTSVDEQGIPIVKFMMLNGLHGGGKPVKTEEGVKAKNALATFLLERGADLQTTSVFTEKVVTTAGQQAIHSILQIKRPGAKLATLRKLADSMVLKMPELSTVDRQRNALVQRKMKAQNVAHHTPHPSEFRLQEDFFLNQDGTSCKQIETIQAGSSGVALMASQDAVPWLQVDQHISQDELAALVLGACPCPDHQKCHRMIVPAYDKSHKPVLLSACLHNLGKQPLKIREVSTSADVAVSSTTVCAVTAFRDEIDQKQWNSLLESPVKVCFDIIQQSGCLLALPCAPWGRSWRSHQGKCDPSVADSFQVHIRIPWAKKESLLKTSGISGIYITPKAEDHKLDDGFAIVWLDKSLGEIKVLAASCPKHFGLVKLVKSNGKRINRGIRFVKEDFKEMHTHLKPGLEPPMQLTCVHFAKIAPTPIGAMFDEVQAWLIEVDWPAKPIRPLGSDAWMIGASTRFEADWASWNNQLLLLTWFPPKNRHDSKVVVAGSHPKSAESQPSSAPSSSDSLQSDPWAMYFQNSGRTLDVDKKQNDPVKMMSSVPRTITGPIEDRFQKQDSQILELKSSLQALHGRIDHHEQTQVTFKNDVKKEFEVIRSEMNHQCHQITSSFEETLNRSLRRQDQQLSDSFTELKALILDRAVPSKKAKTAKPTQDSDEDLG